MPIPHMMTAYPSAFPPTPLPTGHPNLKSHSSIPAFRPRTFPVNHDIRMPQPMPRKSIPSLREAITNLDSQMAVLMSQRQELEAQLDRAVRSQSPVIRLPSELLSNVFTIGVLGMGDEDPILVPTLMLVCRYWAEVALNTPVLWAKITVSPHDSLEKARRRLERSKSCPLDITVNFGPHMDYSFSVSEQIMLAMELFRPALWRTKSFSLSVPSRSQVHAALLQWQGDAPLLESLSIHIFRSIQEEHSASPVFPLFNGNTPRLRSCSFTSFNFGWGLRFFTQLRVLKLGGYYNGSTPPPSTLIAILHQCPELEEIALRNISDVDSYPCASSVDEADIVPAGKMIHLPRLKKVSFSYAGNILARQIMCQISFPNLEHLELGYLQNIGSIIQNLHTQSLTKLPLKYLRIESCLFGEMKFVDLLRRLTSLTTLELVDIEDISSYFLKGLTSSQPWICPRLGSLTVDGCLNLDWDSLRRMIESRLPNDPRGLRYYSSPVEMSFSASEAAAIQARTKPRSGVLPGAQRLRSIDVTRCSQISREMIQWLKMYVADVKSWDELS